MKLFMGCIVVAGLLVAAPASANLTEIYHKNPTFHSTNCSLRAGAIDNVGNLYIGGADTESTAVGFLSKLSPTGATLWAKALSPTHFRGVHHIAIDSGGTPYALFLGNTVSFQVIKASSSTGATLATFTDNTTDSLFVEPEQDALLFDHAGNLFMICTPETGATTPLRVVQINPSNMTMMHVTELSLPTFYEFKRAKPALTSGIYIEAGANYPFYSYSSVLLNVTPTGAHSMYSMGSAQSFGIDPTNGDVIAAGGVETTSPFGVLEVLHSDGSIPFSSVKNYNPHNGIDFADTLVTPNRHVISVGSTLVSSDRDPIYTVGSIDNVVLPFTNDFPDTSVYSQFGLLAIDGYADVTALEYRNGKSKLIEIDENQTGSFRTGELSGPMYEHGTNPAGYTYIVGLYDAYLFQPRDLKDVYMGSTTIKGGNSGTAIIRMYQPYTSDRTVTITSDNAHATVASSKIVTAGQTQVSATVITHAVTTTENATIRVKHGNFTKTFSFSITPT